MIRHIRARNLLSVLLVLGCATLAPAQDGGPREVEQVAAEPVEDSGLWEKLRALHQAARYVEVAEAWNAKAEQTRQIKQQFNEVKFSSYQFTDPTTGSTMELNYQRDADGDNAALDAAIKRCEELAERDKEKARALIEPHGLELSGLDQALNETWSQVGPPDLRMLYESHTVQVVDLDRVAASPANANSEQGMTLLVRVHNLSDSPLNGLEGILTFWDGGGRQVSALPVQLGRMAIPANGGFQDIPVFYALSAFGERVGALVSADRRSLGTTYSPQSVILAGGALLQAPQREIALGGLDPALPIAAPGTIAAQRAEMARRQQAQMRAMQLEQQRRAAAMQQRESVFNPRARIPMPAVGGGATGSGMSTIVYHNDDDDDEIYHRGTCRLLDRTPEKMTLQEAKQEDYEPCEVCNPPKLIK